MRSLGPCELPVRSVEFSPCGEYLLAVARKDDGGAIIFGVESGKRLHALHDAGTQLRGARFSPRGSRVLVRANGGASVWEAATGAFVARLDRGGYLVASAEFSPDGALIAAAWPDGKASIWRWRGGGASRELRHSERRHAVFAATFSPDGSLVATAGEDGTIKAWDVGTGERLAVLGSGTDSSPSYWWPAVAMFTPRGDRVVGIVDADSIGVWRIGEIIGADSARGFRGEATGDSRAPE
ncbi:MAG: WD40 repeat domain-containing protein [Planctomycetota bacterium]